MQKVIDIEPIWADYVPILNEEDLDEVIELPLLNACKELYRKNIITIMSSCNKFNAMGLKKYANNQEIGQHIDEIYNVGNFYSWIMIDYDSLTDENKEIISAYYKENPDRFIYSVEVHEDYINAPLDFKEKYNDSIDMPHYNKRAIIMRYELTIDSTTQEVNDYFLKITASLKPQQKKEEKSTRMKLLELAEKYKKSMEQIGIQTDNSMFKNLYLKDTENVMDQLYGLKSETDILWNLFILATLDIFDLLEEESTLHILSIERNDIYFMYNKREYNIANYRDYPKEQLLQFGNKDRGIKKLRQEKELIDLFRELDIYDILLSQQYRVNEEIKKNL